jgi:hypothetical protein
VSAAAARSSNYQSFVFPPCASDRVAFLVDPRLAASKPTGHAGSARPSHPITSFRMLVSIAEPTTIEILLL